MINECAKRHLPLPNYRSDYSGIIVEFQKYSKDGLQDKSLNESLIKIVLFVQEYGKISNTKVQELCKVSKRTASRYLSKLEEEFLEKQGDTGKGTFYSLKGSLQNDKIR